MVNREQKILELTQRVANDFITLDKKLVFQHGGLRLHASEIHLMQVIADYSGINATEMAKKLGITKGAVSQTLKRLYQKGVVRKTSDPFNKNELTVNFTNLGQEALIAFFQVNAESWQEYLAYLEDMTEAESSTIAQFLKRLESFLGKLR